MLYYKTMIWNQVIITLKYVKWANLFDCVNCQNGMVTSGLSTKQFLFAYRKGFGAIIWEEYHAWCDCAFWRNCSCWLAMYNVWLIREKHPNIYVVRFVHFTMKPWILDFERKRNCMHLFEILLSRRSGDIFCIL